MTIKIHFLSAAVPLTKTFRMEDGAIVKDAYPTVTNVTSHEETISSTLDLYKVITAHAPKGHCLVKGQLNKQLVNEPRRQTTQKDASTRWICLDLDRFVAPDIDTALETLGIADVSYVIQWSSSHGMPGTEGSLSCHVFMLLSHDVPAPSIKIWLQEMNLKHCDSQLTLTRDNNTLRWPLDVTTCQSDKLLYIATPQFLDGIKNPLKVRIEFVKRKLNVLPINRISHSAPDVVRKDTKTKVNALRIAAGMGAQRGGTKFVGDTEVQNKPGEAIITGIKDCGEFIRLNLNGGDSWAYWHFKDNFELIRSFKSDIAFFTKELCPGYYTDLVAARDALAGTPTEDGEIVLAFRDFYSDWYFNGLWNPNTQELKLQRTKSETRVEAWLQSFNKPIPSFIPIWTMEYNPRAEYTVDIERKKVNTYTPTMYRKNARKRTVMLKEECPVIYKVLRSLIGDDDNVEDHFLMWLAMIFQNIAKPRVSWTFHGIEGTGKGIFVHDILVPIIGKHNMALKRASQLNDQFNGWLEQTQLVFVDEVDVDDFKEKGAITANLRNYITEPTLSVRKMQTQSYEVPSYCGFIFSSNRPQPVYIPPTDRRYNLGRFQANKLPMTDYEKYEMIPAELQAFADYLYTIKVNTEIANSICDTPDRQRVARLAITSVEVTANAIKQGDFDSLWDAMPDEELLNTMGLTNPKAGVATAYAMLMRNIARGILAKEEDAEKLSREQLQLIFAHVTGSSGANDSPNKFTSFLRHINIELERMRKNEQRFMGVKVKWVLSSDLEDYLSETLGGKYVPRTAPRKLRVAK
jgi:hypothetical protein